jgi:DnaA family protein
MTQLLLDILPEWEPTLDNFVPGRNAEVQSVLRHALECYGSERCIYLWGEPGSGKTHLLQAMVCLAQARGLTASYRCGGLPEAAQVVAVDGVDELDALRQIALFELYNQLREQQGLLIVSGSAAPAYLGVRDDLRTRLGWGLVYQLHALNDAEKAQALEQHALARGMALTPEVVQYLLRHGRRDLPSLLSTLNALDAHCLRLQRGASVPLLKEVMAGA